MIRKIAITLLLCAAFISVSAQRIDNYTEKLSKANSTTGAKAEVIVHGSAAEALKALQKKPTVQTFTGYRVNIFSDNSQFARANANQTIAKFNELFPGVTPELVHNYPYFRVMVGNFVTQEEAVILCGRIKGTFDRAYVIKEEISVQSLTE